MGNLLQLKEKKPYTTFTKRVKMYGPIYSIRTGATSMVTTRKLGNFLRQYPYLNAFSDKFPTELIPSVNSMSVNVSNRLTTELPTTFRQKFLSESYRRNCLPTELFTYRLLTELITYGLLTELI